MFMSISQKAVSDYRRAFAEFAGKARQARALMAASNPDWPAIDATLLELERARLDYNRHRDILAQLLSSQQPGAHSLPPHSAEPHANRVRAIAELRWELAGKPDGTAEENWFRAEEIVRQATAA